MYNRKDHYYKKAKEEGRASRASYKLEQIQARFKVVKKGDRVVDLGCAPGGWLEVLSEMVGQDGVVIGVDILPIKIRPRKNVQYIQGDINDPDVLNGVAAKLACLPVGMALPNLIPPHPTPSPLGGEGRGEGERATSDEQRATVVLSDMAPNTSGVSFKDSYLSYELAMSALEVAKKLLKKGGNFVTKIFQGEEVEGFKQELRRYFGKVEVYIPPATRQASKELYLVAQNLV